MDMRKIINAVNETVEKSKGSTVLTESKILKESSNFLLSLEETTKKKVKKPTQKKKSKNR